MNTLIGMHFSPWTERARWALDYHGVPYEFSAYTTLLGEPALRLKTGKWTGKVSVPVLATPQGLVQDSFLIAQYADRQSRKPPLVPSTHHAGILAWTEAAERGLRAARIRATRRIQQSVGALAERLPAGVPQPLRKPLVPMSWLGAEFIIRKYHLQDSSDAALHANMDAFLRQAEAALGGRRFVFDELTFADLVIATFMQAIEPVAERYIPLGPASRKQMCEPELAQRYAGLIAWRDDLYAQFR